MRILQQSHCDKCEGFDLSLKGIKQLYWEYIFFFHDASIMTCWIFLSSVSDALSCSPPSRQTRPKQGELKVITIRHHKIVL